MSGLTALENSLNTKIDRIRITRPDSISKKTATPDNCRELSFLFGIFLVEGMLLVEVMGTCQAEFKIRIKASTTAGSKSLPLFSTRYLMTACLGYAFRYTRSLVNAS